MHQHQTSSSDLIEMAAAAAPVVAFGAAERLEGIGCPGCRQPIAAAYGLSVFCTPCGYASPDLALTSSERATVERIAWATA